VTTKQVAELCGVHKQTVCQWAKRNNIKCTAKCKQPYPSPFPDYPPAQIAISKDYVFEEADVEAFKLRRGRGRPKKAEKGQ